MPSPLKASRTYNPYLHSASCIAKKPIARYASISYAESVLTSILQQASLQNTLATNNRESTSEYHYSRGTEGEDSEDSTSLFGPNYSEPSYSLNEAEPSCSLDAGYDTYF